MSYFSELDKLVENLYEVERVIRAMEKQPHTYGSEELLYSEEAHTLKLIAKNEGIIQKELSEIMYRTKGATSVIINKLEKKGLIIKASGNKDQRKNSLYLTEKGKRVNEYHIKYDDERLPDWYYNLNVTEEEMRVANSVIEKSINLSKDILNGKYKDNSY
ncbi:MAG: MarR family transcriptional regulator [Eubacteriales bacterium]|nr:MarR family transcriptional regulator [Eubacteriales bacterium]